MECPVCDVNLVISSREGIEIDHCPQCRGVWLDRGELDKIIERAAPAVLRGGGEDAYGAPPQPPAAAPRHDDRRHEPRYDEPRYDDRRYDDRYDTRYDPRYDKRKKRRSFIEEIFDFD